MAFDPMAENNILLRILWQWGTISDRIVRCLALSDTSFCATNSTTNNREIESEDG